MIQQDLFILLLSSLFVHNFALSQFLGLCPFVGISNHKQGAEGLSLATLCVLTLASGACYLADHYLLQPFDLVYLKTLVFILIIASIVQLLESLIQALSPKLNARLGLYLPLITSNCAVLGVALFGSQGGLESLTQALWYGFCQGLGFGLALMLLASLRLRLNLSLVPKAFQGAPLGLIIAGILSLSFMGFIGLDRI